VSRRFRWIPILRSEIALRGLPNPRLWLGSGSRGRAKSYLLILIVCAFIGIGIAFGIGFAPTLSQASPHTQEPTSSSLITGRVYDQQGQPVEGALVTLRDAHQAKPIVQSTTQSDGRYTLSLPELSSSSAGSAGSEIGTSSLVGPLPSALEVHIERAHFEDGDIVLKTADVRDLLAGQSVVLPDVILLRHIGPAFWVATLVLLAVLIFIATGALHNTLAALVGMVVILSVSYLGPAFHKDLFIFDFYGALRYVDWNVVLLVMGMMIVIAVVERTGVFQWLAFMAYRVSGGRTWLLLPILMLVTGIASAFLDNVTTMLLMTPITVQIALALGIDPLALLVPEVMASNVVGVSTLVGTPTNILIGSYGDISFGAFLRNLTPGVALAFIGLTIYSEFAYRRELRAVSTASPLLLEKLAQQARITEPEHLKKAGVVGLGMLILFIFGERLHLPPSVTALLGATALLLWIRLDIEEMIEAVDWTTLVFFIALFVVIGAVQEVGLISMIAGLVRRLVGNHLLLAMLVITWLTAVLSTVIANIPLTAAMLPVIGYLATMVPGAGNNKVLFYCLSIGSGMGGNGSLIGASANMVTAGIAERAGYPITYAHFFRKGFPALLITVALAMLWLLLHFMLLGGPAAG